MGVLRNGLNLLGISSFLQQVVIGLVIIVAVLLDAPLATGGESMRPLRAGRVLVAAASAPPLTGCGAAAPPARRRARAWPSSSRP